MKIFIDTSSLIKLYFNEKGTSDLDKLFSENIIEEIFVSELTNIEFFSAIYKKFRTGDLLLQNVKDILDAFVCDRDKYSFVLVDSEILNTAQKFIEKYGFKGLRTLDAIQLASAYKVSDLIDMAITDDKLLNEFLNSEAISISMP